MVYTCLLNALERSKHMIKMEAVNYCDKCQKNRIFSDHVLCYSCEQQECPHSESIVEVWIDYVFFEVTRTCVACGKRINREKLRPDTLESMARKLGFEKFMALFEDNDEQA